MGWGGAIKEGVREVEEEGGRERENIVTETLTLRSSQDENVKEFPFLVS